MSQGFMVVALLALLALGVGAIALMVTVYSRQASQTGVTPDPNRSVTDGVALAHLRREFIKRYPAWASRDFQNDRTSPWFSDPEFNDNLQMAGRR